MESLKCFCSRGSYSTRNLPCDTGLSAYNRAMAIVELDEIKTKLPREGRLMALDRRRSKTIGVASSDSAAQPRHAALDGAARQARGRPRQPRRARAQARGARAGDRPAAQHGRHRGPALPVGPPVRRQPRAPWPAGSSPPCRCCSRTSGSAPPPSPSGMIEELSTMSRAKRAGERSTPRPPPGSSSALARLSRETC